MNKIYFVIITLVVLCVLESNGTTVTELFNNLPGDISITFTNAWENMKKAIKKPVRIKRLGRGGRRKKKKNKSTTTTATSTTTDATTVSSTYLMLKKLQLPVLPIPRWAGLSDWNNLQRPRFALKTDEPSTPKEALEGGFKK